MLCWVHGQSGNLGYCSLGKLYGQDMIKYAIPHLYQGSLLTKVSISQQIIGLFEPQGNLVAKGWLEFVMR